MRITIIKLLLLIELQYQIKETTYICVYMCRSRECVCLRARVFVCTRA